MFDAADTSIRCVSSLRICSLHLRIGLEFSNCSIEHWTTPRLAGNPRAAVTCPYATRAFQRSPARRPSIRKLPDRQFAIRFPIARVYSSSSSALDATSSKSSPGVMGSSDGSS